MIALVIRRLLQSLAVMLVVSLLAFVMFRYAGDPVNQMVGAETTSAERQAVRESLGLDQPTLVQFARYVGRVVTLDFGVSYQFRQPVTKLLAERLSATLELSFVAALISLFAGIVLGVYSALNPRGRISSLLQSVSLVGVSLPTFLIGILLIYIFSVSLGWLPAFGRNGLIPVTENWSTGLLTIEGWKSLLLPAITLGLFQMTLIMRLVRSEMLEVLRTDFIKFGVARGLPRARLYFRHALKNTLVPVITVVGLQIGSIIAFSIITETVFQWPGMGLLFLQAVQNVDIPIISTYLLLIALLFVTVNLIVDLIYNLIDPRLKDAAS
ncbi:ABC transporter permease (plasmid) [Shinella sp. H4-D48]|jgi:peptide/nickel transport system permease protein|uniref:ABC transporter permease n=1 Tax=Shinella sedimenti TaxID=2919913 RepID=A0ABT0CNI2_9HYPH|nr:MULTISPECIES: ABC transporter permease [Shinella]MCJ8150150.1 ABC transporter permease [Shinella sedimenti]UNK40507.1 ABC transporter permease [Shinella sp. H4-D48]